MSTIANMNVALSLDDRDFAAGIQRAQASAESFSKKLGSLGTAMSLGITAPLVGIAGVAVKSAADFEQSMNVMAQVTGATASQMESLQAQALELGAVTAFSAGEAAEAMLELGKAGLAPEEIMGAIGGTMDLAAAGGLDLAQAATIAANAMNAFQLPAEEVTNVANMLAAAANASSADVTDLAAGMQMAGAVFASNGQSIEDLAAGMAILANNGIAGSDAGTSLKTMLMRLTAPTDDAAAVMSDLGIATFNADGSMRDFGDIVGQLEKATAGLTDQQRAMALTTIFGADAIRAATILAESGADGFADMQKAVTKEGAAAATAGARMKGFGGAMEYLKGSIDSFMIEAALPFLDSLSGIVRGSADLLTMVGALPDPIRNTALAIGAILAAAGPVLLIVSKLIPAFGMLGTVLGVIASPIGLVVAAVGALVAVFATDFMGVRTAVTSMVDSLLDMAGIDLGGIIDGFKSFGFYIGAVLEDGDALNDWLTHLPEPIQPAVLAIGQLIAAGQELVASGDFGAFVDSITAIDWGGALGTLGDSLNSLKDSAVAALKGIDWGAALTTAGDWLAGLRDGVVSAITSIPWLTHLATAGNFLSGIAQGIKNRLTTINWAGLLATAASWLDGLKNGVVSAIQGIGWAEALATAFATLETAVTAALSALGFAGAGAALDNLKAILGGLPASVDGAKASFDGLLEKITPIVTQVATFFAPALERLQAAFTALPEKLGPLLPKLVALGESFGELTEALAPFVSLLGWGLAIAVELGINRLTTVFETLPDLLGPIIDHVAATIRLISSVLRTTTSVVQAIFDGSWARAWESAQETASEFNEFFRGLFSRLGTFMSAVAKNISEPILQTLKTLGVDIVAPFNNLYKTFETWWNNIVDTFAPVMDAIAAVRKAIEDFVAYVGGLSLTPPWANWGASPVPSGGQTTSPTAVPTTTGGVNTPAPNNGGYPIDITPPPPSGFMGPSGMNGANAVVVNNYGPISNPLDLQEIAYRVAQAQQRRYA